MDREAAGVRLCIGFIAHESYRLREAGVPTGQDPLEPAACIQPSQKDRFSRAVSDCYLPASHILLEWLDGGFPLAIGLSGIFLEQLERWRPDALDVFSEVAMHQCADVLAMTYHNAIASIFDDPREYADDFGRHRQLVQDLFGAGCSVAVDTTGCTPPAVILHAASKLGLDAVSLPDTADLLADASPYRTVPWTDLRILPRHCRLAEDVALRFGQRDWDQYPLTPGKYAGWLAASGGGTVHLLFDLALFGKVYRKESGILEFLRSLPDACRDRGVEGITPSSYARESRDLSAPAVPDSAAAGARAIPHVCLRSVLQHTAFMAVQRAERLLGRTATWRILLDASHFNRMVMKSGECGGERRSRTHQQAYEAFASYMRILSAAEGAAAAEHGGESARVLCCLPPEMAFHFSAAGRPAGFSAYSLEEFADMIQFAADDVIAFHCQRGDFARWIADCLNDPTLAREVEACTERNELIRVLEARIRTQKSG